MTDKKEEWEIGSSKEYQPIDKEAKTVDFAKSATLVGFQLDGRFLIEKDLTENGADEGGIGLVYLARDLKLLGKQVVVKILQKAALQNPDLLRKFQHEKEALIRLDRHPNIVRILDSGTLSDGNPFLVMEFISGYSLRSVLAKKTVLPLEYVAALIESAGNALSAAHSEKILHRDIKPENIMLTPQENGAEHLRLIDFGIARVENSILAPATVVPRGIGTVLYMAPEQLAAHPELTPAADIYALGIVAYEMLTGRLPFNPRSVVEMFELQKKGAPPDIENLRPDLSDKAVRLLLAALEFDSALRPTSAHIFGRDLAQALREKAELRSGGTEIWEQGKAQQKAEENKSVENEPVKIPPTEPSVNPQPEDFGVLQRPNSAKSTGKMLWGGLLGGLGVAVLSGILGVAYWKSSTPDAQTPSADQKLVSSSNVNSASTDSEKPVTTLKFIYFLEVQKMRDGKPFEDPFESSGREIFENGYKFRLNFRASEKGRFYLFNEGKDKDGAVNYNILYPIPLPGKDDALSEKDIFLQTGWNTFGGTAETEKVWLIWTKDVQSVLDEAVKEAFGQKGRVAADAQKTVLKKFIEGREQKNLTTEIEKDEGRKRVNLSGSADVLVYLIELEHR